MHTLSVLSIIATNLSTTIYNGTLPPSTTHSTTVYNALSIQPSTTHSTIVYNALYHRLQRTLPPSTTHSTTVYNALYHHLQRTLYTTVYNTLAIIAEEWVSTFLPLCLWNAKLASNVTPSKISTLRTLALYCCVCLPSLHKQTFHLQQKPRRFYAEKSATPINTFQTQTHWGLQFPDAETTVCWIEWGCLKFLRHFREVLRPATVDLFMHLEARCCNFSSHRYISFRGKICPDGVAAGKLKIFLTDFPWAD